MKSRAFTLIELLVVVLIIGILSAIALPQYRVAVAKARFAEMIPAVHAIVTAQEAYYLANGDYAGVASELDISEIAGCTTRNTDDITCPHFSMDVRCRGCGETVQATNNSLGLQLHEGLFHLGNMRGERECWAVISNNVANQVCRSFGATAPTEDTTLGVNRYKM